MRKWAGKQVYELMWEPLVVGKFGERYCQPGQHGLDVGAPARTHHRLGTFEGGFQAFVDQTGRASCAVGAWRSVLGAPVEAHPAASRAVASTSRRAEPKRRPAASIMSW